MRYSITRSIHKLITLKLAQLPNFLLFNFFEMLHFLKSILFTVLLSYTYFSPLLKHDEALSGNLQHVAKDYKFNLRADTGLKPTAQNGTSVETNTAVEDPADELQREIDQLRKEIKDILKKLGNSTTEDQVATLQKEMQDLYEDQAKCYNQEDQLSKSLKQEFEQKIENLTLETMEATSQINLKLTQLASTVQQLTINEALGGLRDGDVETAIGAFALVKRQPIHTPYIIHNAWRSLKDCKTIISFLVQVNSDSMMQNVTKEDKNLIRASGYSTLYNDFVKVFQFNNAEHSVLIYKIGWDVQNIYNSLEAGETSAKSYLDLLTAQLPKSVSLWTVGPSMKLEVANSDNHFLSNLPICYLDSSTGGTLYENKWRTVQSSDGETYMIVNMDDKPLFLDPELVTLTLYLGKNKYSAFTNVDSAYWNPVAFSNEAVLIQNEINAGFTVPYLGANVSQGDNCQLLIYGDLYGGKKEFYLRDQI